MDEPRRMEKLDTAECWRLAARTRLGRLAVSRGGGAPDVFPVNHLVHEGSVFIRTGTGGKLRAIVSAPEVAYEIDGEEDGRYWSVVLHGQAHRVTAMDDIEASGILQSASWAPTANHIVIRILPVDITGRRFLAPAPPPPGATGGERPGATESSPTEVSRHTKPTPIPHQPPASEPRP